MVSVSQAEKRLRAAEKDVRRLEIELTNSEAVAWRDWAQRQVKEFVRTQPEVLNGLPLEDRKGLKDRIDQLIAVHADRVAENVIALSSVSLDELGAFRHKAAWESLHKPAMDALQAILEEAAFSGADELGGWSWHGSWGVGSGDLAGWPQNTVDRDAFIESLRELFAAIRERDQARLDAAGRAAVDEWDSL